MNKNHTFFRSFFTKFPLFCLFGLVLIAVPLVEIQSFFFIKRSLSSFRKTYKRFNKVRFFHKSALSLEKQSKIQFKKNQTVYPLFSRSTDLGKTLCSLINNEQKKIFISTYMLTDYNVINSLSRAKKRGVAVEVIIDQQSLNFNKLDELKNHDVPIFVHKTKILGEKMHHKIALFSQNNILDKLSKLIWLGSYNFTASGSKKNVESVIVARNNKQLFKVCTSELETIKKESMS